MSILVQLSLSRIWNSLLCSLHFTIWWLAIAGGDWYCLHVCLSKSFVVSILDPKMPNAKIQKQSQERPERVWKFKALPEAARYDHWSWSWSITWKLNSHARSGMIMCMESGYVLPGLEPLNTTWNAKVEGYNFEKTFKQTAKLNMVNVWARAT